MNGKNYNLLIFICVKFWFLKWTFLWGALSKFWPFLVISAFQIFNSLLELYSLYFKQFISAIGGYYYHSKQLLLFKELWGIINLFTLKLFINYSTLKKLQDEIERNHNIIDLGSEEVTNCKENCSVTLLVSREWW